MSLCMAMSTLVMFMHWHYYNWCKKKFTFWDKQNTALNKKINVHYLASNIVLALFTIPVEQGCKQHPPTKNKFTAINNKYIIIN